MTKRKDPQPQQEELKTVRVRPGMSGFYTRIMESGEVGEIPADIPETDDGWFDDVHEVEQPYIGAANVRRTEGDSDVQESTGPDDRDSVSDSGNGDIGQYIAGYSPKGEPIGSVPFSSVDSGVPLTNVQDGKPENDIDAQATAQDTGDAEGAEVQTPKPIAKPDSKKTIPDIIEEIESYGVVEFDRDQKRDELFKLLETIREANK